MSHVLASARCEHGLQVEIGHDCCSRSLEGSRMHTHPPGMRPDWPTWAVMAANLLLILVLVVVVLFWSA